MSFFISAIVNLNQSQHYFQHSIFTISIANLVIIITMVIIFCLAILLPFPRDLKPANHNNAESEDEELEEPSKPRGLSKGMWTARLRYLWLKILPPGKLLPDRQPAYVNSWIYVFGVAT